MKTTTQGLKMGGLGANVGGDDWEKAKRKQELARNFAASVKDSNKAQVFKKPVREAAKEMSSREKAMLFAKNIPKPKAKRSDDQIRTEEDDEDFNSSRQFDPNMLTQVIENPDDENAFTMTENQNGMLIQQQNYGGG